MENKDASMTVDFAASKKIDLQQRILRLLEAYEAETGLEVGGIGLVRKADYQYLEESIRRSLLSSVRVEVKLP